MAILLLAMQPQNFEILYGDYDTDNYKQVAASLATKVLEKFSNTVFLIAGSNANADAEALLTGFEEIVGTQVDVYDCMAGDDITFTEQFVFSNQWQSNKGW